MAFPSSSGASFDVLIRFVTEMAGDDVAQKFSANIEELNKQVVKSNTNLEKQKKILQETKEKFVALIKQYGEQKDALEETSAEYGELQKKLVEAENSVNSQTEAVNQAEKAHKKLTGQLKQAQAEQKKLGQETRKTGEILQNTSAVLNRIGNTLVIGGTAITGGIFKAAKDFIDKSGEQSALTRDWKNATDEIARSYERIGRVAASELLPFMQSAAKIASDIASMIERHPDLIKGAANIGLAALTVGTVTKLVAGLTGIAGQLASLAGKMGVSALGTATSTAGAGGAAAGIAAVGKGAVLVAAPIIAAILTKEIGNVIQRQLGMQESSWKDIATTMTQAVVLPTKTLLLIFRELGLVSGEAAKELNKLINVLAFSATGLQAGGDRMGAQVGGGDIFRRGGYASREIVDAFIQMREAALEAERNFQNQRRQIIEDANQAFATAYRNNTRAVAQINARADDNRAKIISNFVTSSKQAEQQYATQRAQIIRDGNAEIQRIEADRLERLRKMELEHDDRVEDLVANRDALGLVLEQRRFDRERSELDRQTNEEIAQRRRDLAIRLQDAAQAFMQERAQRQAQYQAQLKENEEQRQLELKQQQEQYFEETRQIAQQRAQRLRELQQQFNEERARIRQSFIEKVRDLNASLLGEQQKRRQYYALMQRDLESFLAQYRASLSRIGGAQGGTVPRYAQGGYTPDGIIRAHHGEFVSSRPTTQALESVIGGRLTQQSMLALAAAARGSMSSVVWHDNRRFSGEYTMSMRRANRRDTLQILKDVLK